MFSKSSLLFLALTASPFFHLVEAVVKPQTLGVAANLKECVVGEQGTCESTGNEEQRPFLIEVHDFMTEEECRLYREVPIQETTDGKNGKIPVPSHLLQRLVDALDKVEQRPVKRTLKDIKAFRDHEEIVLARRRKMTKSTDSHVDKYIEGHRHFLEVTGHSAFVFLRTNEEAYFEHGGVRVPAEAGKLLVFASDTLHHTVIQEGATEPVDILGAFDTDYLYAVQGYSRIDGVYINGEDATTSPGPNVTEGTSAELLVALSTQYTSQAGVNVVAEGLGNVSCPSNTYGYNNETIDYMNCTVSFTATMGANDDRVKLTSDGDENYHWDSEVFYYTVVEGTVVEGEEKCTKFLCRLFCNTFLRFVPLLCRLFGGK